MSRAAPKIRTVFACAECGQQSPKWLGQCPACKQWNTLQEEIAAPEPKAGAAPRGWGTHAAARPLPLREVEAREEQRQRTGIGELDRVLGGGVVPGALVLLGGDPGIGKSTLVLAALDRVAQANPDRPVLYVSGEESARQVKLRADRLGVSAANLQVLAETDALKVLQAVESLAPAAVAVDSIQTQYLPELQSAPGTVTQIREVTARLMALAKTTETPVFLIGHVTKDGSIAGPRVLEHMVDTVLYFEGGGAHPYRVLRAHKNRFGSASEIGVFEMKAGGLAEVANPSALFLAERPEDAPGSAVTAVLNGTRTVLVEVQALVAPTGYGTPRRTALGVDGNRVALLAAVLEKKVGLEILPCDLFVNVAGGLSVDDPAADLAVVAALASSFRERALPARTLVLGEVGLAGEVRAVSQPGIRLAEAARLGFQRAIVPAASLRHADAPEGIELVGVTTVADALDRLA
ncbi:DNA repair protein RadA [Anaeromyxobacter dehalogenans]|uniref:DNA repair protein RadA n=1 Tax=Anaeromyxobacter dehalogenans (strain 2CP-C) TaxID=290397 RepID=Q2IF68_ANADE|nr:DNA repair protein RadA [Anaeromyxobacter dehalogenans]ABC83222.1 DNA repair protein RadA [Anaeromyxobacter dehalogenans 2CP-C]